MGMEAKEGGAKLKKKKKNKGLQSPGDTGICLEFSVGAKGGGLRVLSCISAQIKLQEHRRVSPQPSLPPLLQSPDPGILPSSLQTQGSPQVRDPGLWDSGPGTLLNSSSGLGPQLLVSCHVLAVTWSLRSPG